MAMELFLSDGPFRWSCAVVYDVMQRTLSSAALIGPEQQIELKDINDRINFDDLPQPVIRDRYVVYYMKRNGICNGSWHGRAAALWFHPGAGLLHLAGH